MTNPTHSQDQDLRMALAFEIEAQCNVMVYHEEAGRWLNANKDRLLAALRAAPPRPVDAERVEDVAAWLRTRARKETSKSRAHTLCCTAEAFEREFPAHSPDKAVTREGVTNELVAALALPHAGDRERIAAVIEKRWDALVGPAAGSGIGLSRRTMCQEFAAALAPQPTGTEASRGVVPTGWKLVPVEATHAMMIAGDKATETVTDNPSSWEVWRAMLAATPTPPLSPDSTGPADICHDDQLAIWSGDIIGSLGMGGYLREDISYDDKIHMYALVDAEVKGICAALTPSAPIAAPVRRALEAAEGRLALLMKAELPESDHPVATRHVLQWVRDALAASVQEDETREAVVTAAERAYGTLWRHYGLAAGYAYDARKLLLAAIGKEGQRRGIAWSNEKYGPLGPDPRSMLSEEDQREMGL